MSGSSTPADGLILTDILKEYGITSITRHGSVGKGYAIQIMIHGKPLVFAADKSWSNVLKNLKNKIDEFHFKGDTSDDRIKKEVLIQLESTLVQNHAWVTGQDVKESQTGFIRHQDSTSDDSSTINEEPKKLSISDAIRTHSGNGMISGMIVTISDVDALIETARWKCLACNNVIEKKVVNILDVPTKPRECTNSNCESKLGFSDHHDFIDAVALRIQEEDIAGDHALESLHVVVFGDDTRNIQVSECVNILGKFTNVQDPRTKHFHPVLLAQKIKYEHRRKIEVTPDDIRAFKKFIKFPDYEKRLVSMFECQSYHLL